jgi:hypothetical protein
MQHLEGGIIDELRVQDGGDIVQAGARAGYHPSAFDH